MLAGFDREKPLIAFALKDNKPDHLRVRDDRHAYYDWLYGGELAYDAADRGIFHQIKDGRFIGRTAVEGAEYQRIALREANYEPGSPATREFFFTPRTPGLFDVEFFLAKAFNPSHVAKSCVLGVDVKP